jgi:CRISPR system Cascade subunit CasC
MSRFLQFHLLTSYPPSNLNRDDLGRPKTAFMGNSQRLRISSQSLKRAWRTSDLFESALSGHVGVRTKRMGECVRAALAGGWPLSAVLDGNAADSGPLATVPSALAKETGVAVGGVFAKNKKDSENAPLETEQLAHFTPGEIEAVAALVETVRETQKAPDESRLALLGKGRMAVDVAMFGRMLAASPVHNKDAAVQVAHAVTVHKVTVEEDYFTAVDDLNRHEEDMGAGHLGVAEFGAGLFYLYVCVNRELLVQNLGGDTALANTALRALLETAAKTGPSGKQNSYASRAHASYILAERGNQQPRGLSVAFLEPVDGRGNMLGQAIQALENTRDKMDAAYAPLADARASVNVLSGEGTLSQLLDFITE